MNVFSKYGVLLRFGAQCSISKSSCSVIPEGLRVVEFTNGEFDHVHAVLVP